MDEIERENQVMFKMVLDTLIKYHHELQTEPYTDDTTQTRLDSQKKQVRDQIEFIKGKLL